MNKFGVAIALVAVLVGLASVASAHSEATKRPTQTEDFEVEQRLQETDASQRVKQQKSFEGSEQEEPEQFGRRQEPARGHKATARGQRQFQQPENHGAQRPTQTENFEVDQRLRQTDAAQRVQHKFSEGSEREEPEHFSRRQEPVRNRKDPARARRHFQQPENQEAQRPTQTEEFEVDQRLRQTEASQDVKFQATEGSEQEEPEQFGRRREPAKGRKEPFRKHRQPQAQPPNPGPRNRRPEHKGFPVRGPNHGRKPRVGRPGVCGGAGEAKRAHGEPEGENEYPEHNEGDEGCKGGCDFEEQNQAHENEAENGPN